jgi:hypothetical protein
MGDGVFGGEDKRCASVVENVRAVCNGVADSGSAWDEVVGEWKQRGKGDDEASSVAEERQMGFEPCKRDDKSAQAGQRVDSTSQYSH